MPFGISCFKHFLLKIRAWSDSCHCTTYCWAVTQRSRPNISMQAYVDVQRLSNFNCKYEGGIKIKQRTAWPRPKHDINTLSSRNILYIPHGTFWVLSIWDYGCLRMLTGCQGASVDLVALPVPPSGHIRL